MTSDEQKTLKATLLKDMEAEIDTLVEERAANGSKSLNLSQIEDMVLEVRQRLGQKLAERLIETQEQARSAEIPISVVTGRRLHPKGKKTKPSSHA